MPESRQTDVRTVQRAFGLVALLGRNHSPLTLSQLARASALPIATVSRLITTLVHVGFAERTDSGAYRPGAHLARIGLEALQRYKAFRLSDNHLVHLVRTSGETASLAVRVNDEYAVYLRQLPGPRALQHASWAGKFLPLASTASGAALLGKSPYAAMRHPAPVGFTAIASPVRDESGEIVAALSIAGPTDRIADEAITRFGRLVADQARAASLEIASAASDPRSQTARP